jgi:hypothetical protein
MPRPVLPADIRLLKDTALKDDELTQFATQAHVLVSETIPSGALSEARLTIIEQYLAAHLTSLRDKERTSEHVGPATTSFGGQMAMHLDYTSYGEQVMWLDSTGSFATLNRDASAVGGVDAEFAVFGVGPR